MPKSSSFSTLHDMRGATQLFDKTGYIFPAITTATQLCFFSGHACMNGA
jgi:hypothetical protein